jgi:hypothetical protein
MKLHFRCPEKNKVFDSSEYFLEPGHIIAHDENGERELKGKVVLPSCPLCGERHAYDVKDVMCSVDKMRWEQVDGNNN